MATTVSSVTAPAAQKPRDWLKWASLALAIIGLCIAGYIVYEDVSGGETVCPTGSAAFNCNLVQHSIYSKVGPIPVAYLGLVGYIAILLLLAFEPRIPFLAARGTMIVFGLTLFGMLFSGYLTAIEAFVLKTWCVWCVGSAITMTVLFVVSFTRLWRSISAPLDEDELEREG